METTAVTSPKPRSSKRRHGPNKGRRLLILCGLLLGSLAALFTTNWPAPQAEPDVIFVPRTFPSFPHGLVEMSVRVRLAMSSGSGVAIGPRRILTNQHVVRSLAPGETCWVDIPAANGAYVAVVATLLARDQARDLAVLTIPAENAFRRWARIASSMPALGDPMLAVTSASGNLPLCSEGFFSRRTGEGLFQMSVPAFWGSSGGPVFDGATGQLVGLVNRMEKPVEMERGVVFPPFICYCIPFDWISDFLRELP